MQCVPPFNFNLTVSLFSNGNGQIRKFENGKFWQVMRMYDQLVLISIESLGTVDQPRIQVKIQSDREISREKKNVARIFVSRLLNARFSLVPFYEYIAKDRILEELTRRLRGLRIPSTPTVFEALVDSIVEQQISLDVAHVLETNLVKTFGDSLNLEGKIYYAYPTAKNLAPATVEKLRSCGLSTKKAEYVKNISEMILKGDIDLEDYRDYKNPQRIVEELDKIRGIGVWTAELTIVRSMKKYDVIPADDLGLRRVIAHFYCKDRMITAEEARRIAEKWGKWKGLAAFYLIVAEATEK
jgi:DNA-3-methyladenine glycosylase II